MKAFSIAILLLFAAQCYGVKKEQHERIVNFVNCKAAELALWENGMTMNCECIAASPIPYTDLQECIRDAKVASSQVSDSGPIQEFLEKEKATKELVLGYIDAIQKRGHSLATTDNAGFTISQLVNALIRNHDKELKSFVKERKSHKSYKPFMHGTIQELEFAYHSSYPHTEVIEALNEFKTQLNRQRIWNYIVYGIFVLGLGFLGYQVISTNIAKRKEMAIQNSKGPKREIEWASRSSVESKFSSLQRSIRDIMDVVERPLRLPEEETEYLRPEKHPVSKSIKKPETFFQAQPDEKGVFQGEPTQEFVGGKSFYIFEKIGTQQARFRLYDHQQVTNRAMKFISRAIAPACNSENAMSPHLKNIKTLEDGIVEKQPDGKWKVKTKARIRYE